MSAILSFSLSAPRYRGALYCGRGSTSASMPGFCWCCLGNGGLGSCCARALFLLPNSTSFPFAEAAFFRGDFVFARVGMLFLLLQQLKLQNDQATNFANQHKSKTRFKFFA